MTGHGFDPAVCGGRTGSIVPSHGMRKEALPEYGRGPKEEGSGDGH